MVLRYPVCPEAPTSLLRLDNEMNESFDHILSVDELLETCCSLVLVCERHGVSAYLSQSMGLHILILEEIALITA
jgi:hypothetical protein